MKHIAKHLAQYGRNGDTELMHVTKEELASLRGIGSLFGKKITTNPNTGLPEAFDFKSLIPAVVGIGATVLSGGTLSPLAAGLISGAASTAATGDIKQGLASGIMGGMTAGLGQGLTEMGGAAASAGTGSAVNAGAHFSDAAMDAGMQGAASGMGSGAAPHFSDAAMSAGMQGAASDPFSTATAVGGQAPAAGFSADQFMQSASDPQAWDKAFMGDKFSTRTAPGVMALAQSVGGAFTPTYDDIGAEEPSEEAKQEKRQTREYTKPSDPMYALHGGEPTMFSKPRYNFAQGGVVGLMQQKEEEEKKKKPYEQAYWDDVKINNLDPYAPGQYLAREIGMSPRTFSRLGGAGGFDGNLLPGLGIGFASGGGVMSLPQGAPQDDGMMKVIRQIRSRYRSKAAALEDMQIPGSFMQKLGVQNPDDPILQYAFGYTSKQGKKREQMGQLVMPPQQMAGGGSVQGAGDGMSDDIPASINGQQPARLSTDEFVVPSDAVSNLGNGSSEAGHKQLYDMVGRIRAARTGSTAQAPQINPKKVLPR